MAREIYFLLFGGNGGSVGQILTQSEDQTVKPDQTVTIHCNHKPAVDCWTHCCVLKLLVTALLDGCVASQLMVVAGFHSLSVRLRLLLQLYILLQLTGTQIDTRAPAAAVHLPAQLPVRGESLTGHTQHCCSSSLEGGSTMRVGPMSAKERQRWKL
ncbi:hypothetical protein QQF64_013406 [Cirrhinus molitorella]|uniref:Uncharacterized protein n=1 Tax=Cirrhinus molitorella TaxID=172907 RepID=A0ABR3LSD2_9TELE